MSRDKQTEIQRFAIDLQNASQKASKIIVDETANYVKENHKYNNIVDYAKAHIKSRFEYEAEFLTELGYVKASEVVREVAYDFQNRLRHIFLDMCDYNDYGTLNLLQIDSAIEALYDTFFAELKKKYIGKDTNVTTKESEDTE